MCQTPTPIAHPPLLSAQSGSNKYADALNKIVSKADWAQCPYKQQVSERFTNPATTFNPIIAQKQYKDP